MWQSLQVPAPLALASLPSWLILIQSDNVLVPSLLEDEGQLSQKPLRLLLFHNTLYTLLGHELCEEHLLECTISKYSIFGLI